MDQLVGTFAHGNLIRINSYFFLIGMTLYKLWQTYRDEEWYQSIASHLSLRYSAIERRMIETFDFVTPDGENKKIYSYVYASILRDVGSAFDSVVTKLIIRTGDAYEHNIYGNLEFLENLDPELPYRTVLMRLNMKTIIPFRKGRDRLPNWWHAYNDVKHDETTNYSQGNLENSLTSVAALAILNQSVNHHPTIGLFANIGISYPSDAIDVSSHRLLFP